MSGLIERLRRAATACEEWPLTEPPPLTAWATLMTEAADALETEEDIDYWVGDKEEDEKPFDYPDPLTMEDWENG